MTNQNRIKLGVPLDFLLDRQCRLSEWEKNPKSLLGGLRIPDETNPANCSIVLRGRPGTGKSVLAMQIAVNCRRKNKNRFFAVYLSLEESWRQVYGKARSFGWESDLRPLASLTGLDAYASPAQCGQALRRILTRPDGCPLVASCPPPASPADTNHCEREHIGAENDCLPYVLVGSLSPRNLTLDTADSDAVFAARYRQLEYLLRGATYLRNSRLPQLALVCIDSLNVFGDRLLTREQIHQLFDLFQQQHTVGVFVVEEDEGQLVSPDARLHADTIEYLSDAVISLQADEDSDYFVRYFEIVKSRYQHQVYGKHPFRIIGKDQKDTSPKPETNSKEPPVGDDTERETEHGLVIFPSLHYIVYGTDLHNHSEAEKTEAKNSLPHEASPHNQAEPDPEPATEGTPSRVAPFPMGDKNLSFLLPQDCHKGDVVLIAGKRATFKQTLAINFLLSGLTASKDGEPGSTLLIRLHDRPGFKPSPEIRLSKHVTMPNLNAVPDNIGIAAHPTKYDAKVYELRSPHGSGPWFIELAFKSGNILPEEFLYHIRHVIRHAKDKLHPIKRIVLAEVGLIGVSYPFLKRSRTAGDLFLTAFLHTLRNYRSISLLMTGTTDQYTEADEMIDRARTLADAVLTCSQCDVFGNRLVVIDGERLTTGSTGEPAKGGIRRDYGEYVPGVIVPHDEGAHSFEIDLERLEGLVGFGTGEIVRPGLVCRLLEEGSIQKKYNRSIRGILPHTSGGPSNDARRPDNASYGVQVERYRSADSAAVFESLELSKNRPLEQTVVAAIDEFCLAREKNKKDPDSNLAGRAFINLFQRMRHPAYENHATDFMDTIWTKNISHAHPYYANVLLLAYRIRDDKDNPIEITWDDHVLDLTKHDESTLEKLPWSKTRRELYMWWKVRRFVEQIYGKLQRPAEDRSEEPDPNSQKADTIHMFDWVDVPETWACILLDTIVNSGYQKFMVDRPDEEFEAEIRNLLHIEKKISSTELRTMIRELLNIPGTIENMEPEAARKKIHDIDRKRGDMVSGLLKGLNQPALSARLRAPLLHSLQAAQRLFRAAELKGKRRRHRQLGPGCAAYVCWYSQLRDLIQRHPELANKLDVCPLPGGGFRGDWFLGVAQGSVSVALGVELINTLCVQHEEYRRFSLGIGMPVRRKFYEKGDYFAWPGGEHVKLKKLQQIHRDALTRESIPQYRHFHNVLQTVCHQVVGKPGEVIPYKDEDQLWQTLHRIPEQIKMLLRG